MLIPWFIPVAVSVGVMGTQTGLEQRHLARKTHHGPGWWLIVVLGWMPALLWLLAEFVPQY